VEWQNCSSCKEQKWGMKKLASRKNWRKWAKMDNNK
jgi:hypothetical protein